MTTPTSRRPRRGRMAAAVAAVVLAVAGLVLIVTVPNQPGDPTQAIAGAPSSTTSTPNTPNPPASPGAVAPGGLVSTPGSDAGTTSGPAVPVPSSGPANGPAPGQPGATAPEQSGPSSNATPGASAGNTGDPAGSSDNPGNAAPSVSASARAAALAGAPAVMPGGTISLPSLGVGPVGIGPSCAEPDGILEPPSSQGPMTCSWRGSAALDASSGMTTEAGHINYNGRQGAFSRLSQLRPGDPVYTASSTGRVQAWVVTREYARSKTLPLDVSAFQGPDGPRLLALVSCGGKLTGRSYDANIFAFAVPV